jgi:hypothetical protein
MHDENADDDRYFLLVNELIENSRGIELNAVLIDVDTGGPGRVVLPGDVHPVVADRAREDFALVEGVFRHFPLGSGRRLFRAATARDGWEREEEKSQEGGNTDGHESRHGAILLSREASYRAETTPWPF